MVVYAIEENLLAREFKELLISSSLGERRPVHDDARIEAMVKAANLIITARKSGILIGVARALTDFVYCTYLSDLAVDKKYQKHGIGKKLIEKMKAATPQAKLILLSAPKAIDFYTAIGMARHNACFIMD